MRAGRTAFWLTSVLILSWTPALSQSEQDSTLTSVEIFPETESMLEQIESEEEDPGLLDRILALQEHPLDLNAASRRELAVIPGLTPGDIGSILRLRRSLKRFPSVEHLSLLDDGDIVLNKVRPFVFVVPEGIPPAVSSVRMTARTIKDLQTRRGYTDGSFLGSGLKAYSRLTINHGRRFAAGLLTEKDAGERIGDGFLSGYAAMTDVGVLSKLVAGDYVVEAGQGLVLWRSSAFGKGAEAVAVSRKSESGIQPYRSSDEFNFFRGVAATAHVPFGQDRISLSGWFSRRSLDASGSEDGITSFYTAGLFRTDSELRRRGAVTGTMIGGRIRYLSGEFSIGATVTSSRFDKPVLSERLFRFRGRESTVGSLDAELALGWLSPNIAQVTLSAELARSGDAMAGIVVATLNVSRGASLAAVYRNYSPRFVSLQANGFGERGETQNERGLYLACDLRPASWLRINGYVDHFHYPWRTFDNPLPSSGRELFVQSDARLGRSLDLSMRISAKSTETMKSAVDPLLRNIRVQTESEHRRLRLTATYTVSRQVRMRGRVERVDVSYPLLGYSEPGWLVFQELRYSSARINVDGRMIFFHTDSYDSRIYEYESDLRGVFSNPALFGRGRRWYLMIRWRAIDMLTLSMKYAETQKESVRSISSGLTEITGNIDNRISMQIEIKL